MAVTGYFTAEVRAGLTWVDVYRFRLAVPKLSDAQLDADEAVLRDIGRRGLLPGHDVNTAQHRIDEERETRHTLVAGRTIRCPDGTHVPMPHECAVRLASAVRTEVLYGSQLRMYWRTRHDSPNAWNTVRDFAIGLHGVRRHTRRVLAAGARGTDYPDMPKRWKAPRRGYRLMKREVPTSLKPMNLK